MPNPAQKQRYQKRFSAIESSFRIEGMDPSGDPAYEEVKARVLAGEKRQAGAGASGKFEPQPSPSRSDRIALADEPRSLLLSRNHDPSQQIRNTVPTGVEGGRGPSGGACLVFAGGRTTARADG